jgi:thiamine kinase-like enzyme
MPATLESVLAQIPGWANRTDLIIEPLAGLTNCNYLVTAGGQKYVLRVGRENASRLGIDRGVEFTALQAAFRAGIGPELAHFFFPAGHMVTRFIPGRRWTLDEFRQPATLQRVAAAVKRVHSLQAIQGVFSPFQRVESYASQVRNAGLAIPADFEALRKSMDAIQARQQMDVSPWWRLCHNDLYSVNLLDDGNVRILDWEFAGMGDIYFDLAELVYAYDSDGPLPAEQEEFLLKCYFGTVTDFERQRLQDMKFMVNFFSAMWGLLHQALVLEGVVPAVVGFDYLGFARGIFDGTLTNLQKSLI